MSKKSSASSASSGGIQTLLTDHVEKIVLGAIGVVMLWCIYSGLNVSSIEREKVPNDLVTKATAAKTAIEGTTWQQVQGERNVKQEFFNTVTTRTQITDVSPYTFSAPLDPPFVQTLRPRVDPEIFSPTELRVVCMYGPIALNSQSGEKDPLAKFEPAGKSKSKDKAKKKSTRFEESTEGDEEPAMDQVAKSSDGGFDSAGDMAKQMERMKDIMGAMKKGGGGMGGGSAVRNAPEEAQFGVRAPNAIPKSRNAIVILATVPYEQQAIKFQQAFVAAGDFLPNRDTPKYRKILVQRAEVIGDESDPAKLNWVSIRVEDLDKMEAQYAMRVGEIADADALDPVLTRPSPPFLVTDLTPSLIHPGISRVIKKVVSKVSMSEKDADGNAVDGQEGDAPRRKKSVMSKAPSEDQMKDANRKPKSIEFPTKKLLRFVDFKVNPNFSYRYRIQVLLEDPNNPSTATKPDQARLAESVRARIRSADPSLANMVASPWSEPSEVATFPVVTDRFIAGAVTNKKARMLTVKWDEQLSANLCVETEKSRGDVLNVRGKDAIRAAKAPEGGEIEVMHPAKGELLKSPVQLVSTNAVVVDILGGEPLVGFRDPETNANFQAPGEVLVMDSSGKLRVSDENASVEEFRRYAVIETPKKGRRSAAKSEDTGDRSADMMKSQMDVMKKMMGKGGKGKGGMPKAKSK